MRLTDEEIRHLAERGHALSAGAAQELARRLVAAEVKLGEMAQEEESRRPTEHPATVVGDFAGSAY
jgi:hypothetical protein